MMPSFQHAQLISSVTLVGCGGTGAQLARSVCRVLFDLKQHRQHLPTLRLVDPDQVAESNLGRQLYTAGDLHQSKAAVLARRFSLALGLDIAYFPEPFDARKHADSHTLLLGAVDNHLARRELAQADCLWLDCGNHHNAGQVVLGNTRDAQRVRHSLANSTYRYLPNAALTFPTLLEPEPSAPTQESPASCAELTERGEQAVLVNDLMASVAAQYIYKLLHHEPLQTWLSFVDCDSIAVRSIGVSPDNIQAYLGAA